MKNLLLATILLLLIGGCQSTTPNLVVTVSNLEELQEAIQQAKPGTEIAMTDGEWQDLSIRFIGNGTAAAPIVLKAATPGGVKITGSSDLKIGGEYLVVDGLMFTDGYSPSSAVIEFAVHEDTVANHCRVTNVVIDAFNKPQRNQTDLWVQFKGRYNQLDHSYLAGKSNRGPTVRVDLAGNRSIKNYHRISDNHFGPRPPKGGPSAETIQIGNSYTSMAPSYTLVENNLFERCNGEVEVISSKTNFNEFRGNIFYKSEGSLVTRHGNYCIVDGNYFIGDEDSPHVGGVRLIGTGHWVTNNYFYKLRGEIFRAPIAVMNGIPRSSINRYIQVTDVNVAYNTFVDCTSPWQFGVGSNVDQKDVLPPSEIRSLTPIRTIFANNLIYNSEGDQKPIFRHDSIDGISFVSNVIDNQGVVFRGVEGLERAQIKMTEEVENLWIPTTAIADPAPFKGFEYEKIRTDLFGNSRKQQNSLGATIVPVEAPNELLDYKQFGPDWFDAAERESERATYSVSSEEDLKAVISELKDGDEVVFEADNLEIRGSIKIDKKLTFRSTDGRRAKIQYVGSDDTPLFEMNPKGDLTVKSLEINGNNENIAFAPLAKNMSSLFNLSVIDSEISNFKYVLKAYKYSFSEFIKFQNSIVRNCENGIELAAEDDDRGDYNAENLLIVDCQFSGVKQNVIDYYRGGYDESTIGGNLLVQNSTFEGCGANERNRTLINTYGIINVNLEGNTFRNNPVRKIAQLWGAKNNLESGNEMMNSGQIITEQNLPLKLMY
jgi:poly(beta-D-mannuronate) lyase